MEIYVTKMDVINVLKRMVQIVQAVNHYLELDFLIILMSDFLEAPVFIFLATSCLILN